MIINCPFCSIDEEKTRIIEEKANTFVILSNPRLLPGHVLVVPKRHVEEIFDLTSNERKEIFDLAIKYQKKIIDKIASGCDMRHFYRPFASESAARVEHIQIHLLPRERNDSLKEMMRLEKKLWTALVPSEREKFTRSLGK